VKKHYAKVTRFAKLYFKKNIFSIKLSHFIFDYIKNILTLFEFFCEVGFVIQYVLALTFYKIGYNKPPCFKATQFYDVSSAKRNS